jgi:hypothetical protein
MVRKKQKEDKFTIEEALEWLGEVPEKGDQVYDFGNTPVLLTHPAINEGDTVQGYFVGNWTTRLLSRSTFEIVNLDAQIVLPTINLKLPKRRSPVNVFPGSIWVSMGQFEVPPYLNNLFFKPNEGTFDLRNRFYQAVFGLHVHFAYAYGDSRYLNIEEPANLLLKTVGTVEKGGALTASGIGRVISGFFNGLMFACSHGSKKPTTPKKCKATSPKGWLCTRSKAHAGKHTNPVSKERW